MDVLSIIRNMCRHYVTGSIVVAVTASRLCAPISYTRCEDELFALSVFFPRRHSVRVCTMLFLIEAIGFVLHIYDKTKFNFASFLLTFPPEDRNISFPEYYIYFLYFWNSRRWTKSKLWVVLSQYVKLIKAALMDVVTVKTMHSEQWRQLAYAWLFCVATCFSAGHFWKTGLHAKWSTTTFYAFHSWVVLKPFCWSVDLASRTTRVCLCDLFLWGLANEETWSKPKTTDELEQQIRGTSSLFLFS